MRETRALVVEHLAMISNCIEGDGGGQNFGTGGHVTQNRSL